MRGAYGIELVMCGSGARCCGHGPPAAAHLGRLYCTLMEEQRAWQQRIHAQLFRQGCPPIKALLTETGRQEGAGVATPLYMAATGPRNLRTAGEIADGLIVLNGAAPESLRKTLAIVPDGEEVRSPSLGSLRRMVTSFCLPTTDPERDARRLKPLCVAMARHLGAAGALAERGITVRPGGPSRPVKPDLMHPKDWDGAIDAVDHLVSDQDALAFGRAFCLFGSLEEISSQLEEMRTMEVEEVMLQELESFRLPHRWVQECAVLNRPRSAGGPDTSIDQVQRG